MDHNIIQLASARPRGNGIQSPGPIPAKDLPDQIELLRDEVRRRAAEQDEFDRDLRIIGYGLLFGYVWVIGFAVAKTMGAF